MTENELQQLSQLISAARAVIENWESGDLAYSVRELHACLDPYDDDPRFAIKEEST